ncbi:MAG TPA: hypothetical protein VFC41_05410, partial [Anaerovoracaceae bacterium]|nr:hypothetical protein [Anaerovoracaceae bacterium]
FSTCKKEDNQENFCYSSSLISQINSGDLAVHGLTYNNNCLIYESTEPYLYKKFSYDAQNSLKKVELAYSFNPFSCVMIPGQSLESDPRKAEVSQFSEFEYDDALRLTKKSNYFINSGNPQLTSYQTYDYGNDQIIKSSTFNPQGLLTLYNDYEYDDSGNITRDDLYANNSGIMLVQTIICEFDNKNNPYQIFACEGIPGIYTNKNNIIKETTVSYNSTTESRNARQNVYEYNSLDYPVKINGLVCKYGK